MITMAVAAVTQASAALPDNYQMVCQSEQSIGYHWSNGAYVQAKFKLDSYVITVGETKFCRADRASDYKLADVLQERSVCVNMTRVGGTPYPAMAFRCIETTFPSEDARVSLNCRNVLGLNFAADPDGWFHLHTMHSSTTKSPKNGRKDDQSLEVGKCSRTR